MDRRFSRGIVFAICVAYSVTFFAFYPDVVTNDDESMYLRHALIMLEGKSHLTKLDALTGGPVEYLPSRYAAGTAFLMSPLVAWFGWRGAYLLPWLSLVVGTIMLARWLQDEDRSPLWALYAIGYMPSLVLGRVAMSDVPSFLVVTLGLWLFWRGLDRDWPWWLGSGFVAGASWLFRESNPIVFVPFFAGTVLRRETKC